MLGAWRTFNAPLLIVAVAGTGTGAGTTIDSIRVELLNIASLSTSGIDFEASYSMPVGAGNLTARLFGNYTDTLISDDGLGTPRTYNAAGVIQNVGSVVDRAGQVGGFQSGARSRRGSSHTCEGPRRSSRSRGVSTSAVQGRSTPLSAPCRASSAR